jgi:O-antigen/teichoic acid export membrane protein
MVFQLDEGDRQSMTASTCTYFEDLETSADLGRLAKRGGVASVAGQYGNGVLQIVGVVFLARLLTPEDFGLAAIVMVLTQFAPLLIDFGTGDATIQRSKITHSQVSALFWLNSGIGLAIAVVLAACGPLIAWLYHEPRLQPIALCSAITFVFTGISAQHLSLLRRTMQFAAIAKLQLLSAVAGLVLAILLATSGCSYWALVLRPIVSAACIAAGAWLACSWRPGFPVFDAEVKSMVRFGMHVLGFSITHTVARVADRIALGLFYLPREVGYYQNAQNMSDNALSFPIGGLHGVGSAGLSKLRSNPGALKQKYEATLSALAFFVMPTAAILSVTGQDVAVVLLGETWRTSGLLLSIMALRGIVEFIELSQGWLHVSSGRADRWKNWGVLTAIMRVLAILGGLRFGAEGVAVALVAAGWLIALPSVSYAGRPLGIGAALVVRAVRAPLLGATIALTAGWWLQAILLADFSALFRIFLSAFLCAVIYLLIVVGLLRTTEPIRVVGTLMQDFGPARRNADHWPASRALPQRLGVLHKKFAALSKFRVSGRART